MNRSAPDDSSLLLDIHDGVATLTLNRPEQRNALSRSLRTALTEALVTLEADDAVAVLIVTGSGTDSFCTGLDLKEVESSPLDPSEMGVDSAFMQAVSRCTKPMIAAVNGTAVAGGMEIALLCDIALASTRARFADTHCRVGIYGAWGLPQYLAMAVGPVRARYLCYTGNYLDAATARKWGLVLDVVEPTALMPACQKLASEIAAVDRATLREVKESLRVGMLDGFSEGLRLEAAYAKASVERFDPAAFAARRERVMRRGREQAAPLGEAMASGNAGGPIWNPQENLR